jgi:hypothetical protein
LPIVSALPPSWRYAWLSGLAFLAALALPGPPELRAQSGLPAACDRKVLDGYLRREQLPNFKGCTAEAAKGWLAEHEFFPVPTIELEGRPEIPEGIVFDQAPEGGTSLGLIEAGIVLKVSSGPPPVPMIDKFSVRDAAAVDEGAPLEFTITREPSANRVGVTYETRELEGPGEAVADRDFKPVSATVEFPPNVATKSVSIETLAVAGAGGDRRVHLFLISTGGHVIADAEGVGIIRDKPEPPPLETPAPSFALTSTSVMPGDLPSFVVTQAGPGQAYKLEATIFRDGVQSSGPQIIEFADGKTKAVVETGDLYCVHVVEIRVRDPLSRARIEPDTARADLDTGPSCGSPPSYDFWEFLSDWGLWLLCALAALIAAMVIWRKWPPPPPAVPSATWKLDPGESRMVDPDGSAFAAPPFRVVVRIRTGVATLPHGLQISREESPDD